MQHRNLGRAVAYWVRRVTRLIFLLAGVIWSAQLINAAIVDSAVFGPETFYRSTGKPIVEVRDFPVDDTAAQYLVQIQNGQADGQDRISSAIIRLNGKKIVVAKDLNQNVANLNIPVLLQADNQLTVELRSKPGSFLTITICLADGSDSEPTCNSPPVADAGPDQTVAIGNTAKLDASGSTDADGDPLTYAWMLKTVPSGSSATLSDPTGIMPEFFVDLPGTYFGELVVNDGAVDSLPDTVQIDTENSPPVADAGADQSVRVADLVELDGSGSFDADGNPLGYSWSIVASPEGSAAALDNPILERPSFVPDLPGSYTVELVVNDGQADSNADTVTVTTLNSPPVADAGDDQSVTAGDVVNLDGNLSSDVDGDALTFAWSLLSVPLGSDAALSDATVATPSFPSDLEGMYIAQLIVSDGSEDSDPDTTVVTAAAANQAPIALASSDAMSVALGTLVNLDGSGSSDPEDDPLEYRWSLLTPASSTASLSSSTSIAPNFTPDVAGSYVATLIVDDGSLPSLPDSVTITAGVANNPPDLITVGNRSITVGQNYSTRLFAVDPDPGDILSFSLVLAPAGMSIDGVTGNLQWTPTAVQLGLHNVRAMVTDAGDLSDIEDFNVEVSQPLALPPANAPPRLDPLNDQALTAGELLELQAVATDPDAGDSVTFSLLLAPAGMTIDANTGQVQWTPGAGQLGRHDVVVQTIDNGGLVAVESLIVTVNAVNTAPVANDDLYSARIGETLTVPAPGVMQNDGDPENNPLTAALVIPPDNGILNFDTDGSFDYTPVPPTPPALGVPTLKWATATGITRSTPLVIDLDRDGSAEIVALIQTASGGVYHLQAFSGIDGTVVFDVDMVQPDANPKINACAVTGCEIAAADIDLDGFPEILVIDGFDGKFQSTDPLRRQFYAFEHDGTYKFISEDVVSDPKIDATSGYTKLAIANILGDEHPEILVGYEADGPGADNVEFVTAYDYQGEIIWTATGQGRTEGLNPATGLVTAADIDLDGDMEILFGDDVFDHLGNHLFSVIDPQSPASGGLRVTDVIALNLDDDAFPELVYNSIGTRLLAYEHDGTFIDNGIWPVSTLSTALSALSAGDIDDDGEVEILVSASNGGSSGPNAGVVIALEKDGSVAWRSEFGVRTFDGYATAFDLNNDGVSEVIYHARNGAHSDGTLYVLNGLDGSVVHSLPVPRQTLSSLERIISGPVIADVDGDNAAEIVVMSSNSISEEPAFSVFQSPLDDWAPTRPVWNQPTYHVTNINQDGSVPVQEPINWLLNGLNNFRVNVPLPDEIPPTLETFSYKNNDGALDSNVATVTLNVLPPGNPPVFLTLPDDKTTVGFPYQYAPIVFDPDFGDISTFSLSSAPPGMTIDPITGVVNWTPAVEETVAVGITVTDTQGFTAIQRYALEAGLPVTVPDVVGNTRAAAETAVITANLIVGAIRSSADPVVPADSVISQSPVAGTVAEFGAAVNLTVSTGAGPGDIDDDGDGFTENQGDCNDTPGSGDTIFPGANDPAGDGIDQDCDGIDGNLTIVEILVGPMSSTILVGQQVELQATAIFEDGTSQDVTKLVTWSNGSNVFTGGSSGAFPITATLGANAGNADVSVAATTADAIPPVANITAPAANSTITEPVDIIGTASDANFLKYELAIAPAGETNFTVINTSTTPVTSGVLGQFDPTMLLNDLYTVRLTVFDRGGNVTTVETVYQVDENMKVGNFTLSFTDLSIPMSGIPITVTRTYDSRDKRKGDFGIGWRLDVKSLTCRANRVLGTGWQVVKSGLSFALLPTDSHKVSLTLASGRVEEFDLVISPTVSPLVPFPPFANRASFRPRAGTLGTLTSLDNNNLTILAPQPGVITLLDDITNTTYNPQRFKYTSTDGTEIVIHKVDGVESIKDPNGNTLTFGPGGIVHSVGKSVLFNRDSEGRIAGVTDPEGNLQTYTYGTNGDLTRHTDAEGNITRFFYNRTHGLIRIEDALGNQPVRNEYDDAGRLLATIDAEGNRVEFDHDIAGRQEMQTDSRGSQQVIVYDNSGNVLSVERVVTIEGAPTVARETFEYDLSGNEIVQVDADGRRTERTFDNRQNVTRTALDPAGLNIVNQSTYDARANPVTLTDALGGIITLGYDARGNQASLTDPRGNSSSTTWNGSGQMLVQVDALGGQLVTGYTTFGQPSTEESFDSSGALLSRQEYSYDANGNILVQTRYRKINGVLTPLTTTFAYDGNNRLISKTDPLGAIGLTEYDAAGNVIARTDGNGNRTGFQYDSRRQLIQTDFADGTTMRNEYDANGNLIRKIDELNRVTVLEFDELNQLVRTINPDGSVSQSVYTPAGLVAASIDERGNRTDFEFDSAGRQIVIRDPAVLVSGVLVRPERRAEYTPSGSQTASIDANGFRTETEFDAMGNWTRITFPDGTSVERALDALHRPIAETDEEGRVTEFTYDHLGQLTSVSKPPPMPGDSAPVTTYSYDLNGNRVSQTDALGHTTRFEYDALNRLTKQILPGGQFESFTYDANGNRISATDPNGDILSFSHNSMNRPISRNFSDGSVSHEVSYTATGRRASVIDARGQTTFSYDAVDRLIGVVQPDGQTLAYVYDASGNLTRLTANGRVVDYEYDALNRQTRVIAPEGTTDYSYDAVGNILTTTTPNGVATTHSYDSRNRITRAEHRTDGGALLGSFDYGLRPNGMRATLTEANGDVESYTYDALNRLVSETRNGAQARTLSYDYDAVGNRTRGVRNGVETLYSYDNNDRLLSHGGTLYTYDANGNRRSTVVGATVTSYDWDLLDRLTDVNAPAGSASFTYDADGNRIGRAGPGGGVNYLVDNQNATGFAQVMAERDDTDITLATYTYGRDLLASDLSSGPNFYHNDALGSTRLLSDAAGNVTDTYIYEGFGADAGTMGNSTNRYLYTGEQLEPSIAGYYLRARYLDPETGRFLSRDPFAGFMDQPASLHDYQYAANNPVNFIDPGGEETLQSLAVAIGIEVGGFFGIDLSDDPPPSCQPPPGTRSWKLVVKVKGKTETKFCNANNWLTVWQSRLLYAPLDRIRTLPNSLAQIRTSDGAIVTMGPETEITLQEFDDRTGRIRFQTTGERASLRAKLRRLVRGKRRFEVETPNDVLAARG